MTIIIILGNKEIINLLNFMKENTKRHKILMILIKFKFFMPWRMNQTSIIWHLFQINCFSELIYKVMKTEQKKLSVMLSTGQMKLHQVILLSKKKLVQALIQWLKPTQTSIESKYYKIKT